MSETPQGRRRLWSWVSALAAGSAVVGACSVVFAGAGLGTALVANFCAQIAFVSAVSCAVFLACGRWRVAGVLGVCVLVHLLFLVPGRAPRGEGEPAVRLLVHNARTFDGDLPGLIGRVLASDADVVVLVEVEPELIRLVARDRPFEEVYAHHLKRGPRPDRTSWRLVLSRWPLEDRRTADEMCCVVDAPDGAFGLIALHPASPRDGKRWRAGNAMVREAVALANDLADEGLPVVAAGDLNGGPAGHRARVLRREGALSACKPWWLPTGTFPSVAPGFLRLAIDDAWVSEGWGVTGWRVHADSGSDHAAVEIGLVRRR